MRKSTLKNKFFSERLKIKQNTVNISQYQFRSVCHSRYLITVIWF